MGGIKKTTCIYFYPILREAKITRSRDIPLEVTVPPEVNVYKTVNGHLLCDTEIPPEFIKVVEI